MYAGLVSLQEKINSRVLRERFLILLSILAVLFMAWNFVLQNPIEQKRAGLSLQLDAAVAESKAIETQITNLTIAAANSPALQKQKDIASLRSQIDRVETQLSAMSQGLINAQQLPAALEAILERVGHLQLVSIETLPATELQLSAPANPPAASTAPDAAAAAPSQSRATGVYKHAVVVRVKGGYFELIQLLSALESLPWKFYWESLDYTVLKYPQAEVELRVFTLSSEEGLLGV